jgi:hypothetical protein
VALGYATAPPRLGTLTVSPEGLRAGLSLVVPSLSLLLSAEDAMILHKLTRGNAVLFAHLALLGESIEVPSEVSPGQVKTYRCWGGGRAEVGLVRCRSAGFEAQLAPADVPEKVAYEYCKSIVAPPADFKVQEVKRSFRAPRASLALKTVCGFRGDFISRNLYAYDDPATAPPTPTVVYAVAALVVVQSLGAGGGAQAHFCAHDDDVTCLALEAGGNARRAASGQMGRMAKGGKDGGGENGACALVWSVGSRKLLYR